MNPICCSKCVKFLLYIYTILSIAASVFYLVIGIKDMDWLYIIIGACGILLYLLSLCIYKLCCSCDIDEHVIILV